MIGLRAQPRSIVVEADPEFTFSGGPKLLLLHGGPGCTHEYFEVFESFLPQAGVELYFYDQLGSHHSSQPDHADLWEIERFVDEVEQVRQALALDGSNFFLLGHSWGGILAIEYALRHQQYLKGLVISNMVWSVPEYNRYAEENFLRQLPAGVLAELQAIEAAEDYDNPRYMELLIPHHYEHHVLRRPYAQWPDSVLHAFEHLNPKVYIPMQGPSGIAGLTYHGFRLPLSPLVPPTTPWIPSRWRLWPRLCRGVPISTARMEAIWRWLMTRWFTSRV